MGTEAHRGATLIARKAPEEAADLPQTLPMPTPPERWFFDLEGPKKDIWVWHRVAHDGKVIERSKGTFNFYLDALADAQQQGFSGAPSFGKPGPLS